MTDENQQSKKDTSKKTEPTAPATAATKTETPQTEKAIEDKKDAALPPVSEPAPLKDLPASPAARLDSLARLATRGEPAKSVKEEEKPVEKTVEPTPPPPEQPEPSDAKALKGEPELEITKEEESEPVQEVKEEEIKTPVETPPIVKTKVMQPSDKQRPKAPSPPPPTPAKVIGIPEDSPVVPPASATPISKKEKDGFMTKFLDKLKEFRGRANKKRHEHVEENLKKIMEFAWEKQKVTNDDVERLTGVGDIRAKQYLQMLEKQGKLIQFGRTKNTFYKPTQ